MARRSPNAQRESPSSRTVYPGWYMGRTVHIHAKAHLDNQTVLTTQLFFDDETSSGLGVRAGALLVARPGRDVLNDWDGIFDDQLVLKLSSSEDDGYAGAINFDVERA